MYPRVSTCHSSKNYLTSIVTNNKITGVLHFDSKAIVEDYIRSLGMPATFFIPAIFMHYILLQLQPTGPDSKTYKLVIPISDTTQIPYISITSDAGKYLKAILLNRSSLLGKQVLAAESSHNSLEVVKILQEKGGLDVEFVQALEGQYRAALGSKGFPDWLQDDLLANLKYIEEYGYYGGEDFVKGKDVSASS